jgi:hypothetical protein
MTVFHLQLTSNEQTFKYTFSEEFLTKQYELGLIKMDGELRTESKNDLKQTLNSTDMNNNQINNIESNFSLPTIDNIPYSL